ncbi:MAG: hypothetical protein ACRDUV_20475 [Pseudonocardiaceae bacterium]
MKTLVTGPDLEDRVSRWLRERTGAKTPSPEGAHLIRRRDTDRYAHMMARVFCKDVLNVDPNLTVD